MATPALAKNRSTGPNAASAASIRSTLPPLGGHVGDDRHGAGEAGRRRPVRIEDVGDDDRGPRHGSAGPGPLRSRAAPVTITWASASSMGGERNDRVNDVAVPLCRGYGVSR